MTTKFWREFVFIVYWRICLCINLTKQEKIHVRNNTASQNTRNSRQMMTSLGHLKWRGDEQLLDLVSNKPTVNQYYCKEKEATDEIKPNVKND